MSAPVAGRGLDLRGRWLAITLATVLMQLSFWPVVAAVAGAPELGADTGPPLALGLALVPLVLGVLAFASRRHGAPGPLLRAMGLFLLIGLPLCLFDVTLGLLVGYGAGGVVALAPTDPPATRWRWAAVGLVATYVLVLLVVLPGLAVMTAAVAPFTVLGLVDQVVEGRAADRLGAAARG